MKVIFKDTGEVKDVKFGYAVNYLFPNNLAQKATPEKLEALKKKKAKKKKQTVLSQKKSQKQAEKLDGKKLTFKVKTDEDNNVYGSVTQKDIADKLKIEKSQVKLNNSIKDLGEYEVKLDIDGFEAKVKVVLEPEEDK